MTPDRLTRPFIVLAIALGILVGSPGVASAKTTQNSGYSYISNNDCAWTQAWLTDEGSNPGLWSVGTMDWSWGGVACADHSRVAQTQNIAVKQNLMIWFSNQPNGNNGWIICETGAPWVYNASPSHEVWTGFGWDRPPCGSGYYRSWSQAQTFWGSWHTTNAILGNDWVIIN
jgi:hypothetical protein